MAATSLKSRSIPRPAPRSIARYTAVDDLGNVINPVLVEGQVHGGVVQGAGQVFGEHAIYDAATGAVVDGQFRGLPHAACKPGCMTSRCTIIRCRRRQMRSARKASVNPGCSGSLPALVNATIDALSPLGIKHLDMPFTPAKIWGAISAARSR